MTEEKQDVPLTVVEKGKKSSRGMTIATVNINVAYDVKKNVEKYVRYVEIAAEKGADLLVFPEQSLQGYIWETEPRPALDAEVLKYHFDNAEPLPGEASNKLTELAKKHDMYIVFGLTEKIESYGHGMGTLFNSAALVGPEGLVGVYRKVHQPGFEHHLFTGGSGLEVFETPFARIGMLICYDKCFPEICRVYAIKGADILVMPTAWPSAGTLKFGEAVCDDYAGYLYDLFDRSRAAENQLWFVSSNNTGVDHRSKWNYYGHSRIINPSGVSIAEIGREEGIAVAHGLDIRGEILNARTSYFGGLNFLKDRVPALYGPIVEEIG